MTALAAAIPQRSPPQSGVTVYQNAKAAVDASNLADGYVSVKYTGGKDVRIKVRITKSGTTDYYDYNLNNKGTLRPSSPRAMGSTPSASTRTPPAPSTPAPTPAR